MTREPLPHPVDDIVEGEIALPKSPLQRTLAHPEASRDVCKSGRTSAQGLLDGSFDTGMNLVVAGGLLQEQLRVSLENVQQAFVCAGDRTLGNLGGDQNGVDRLIETDGGAGQSLAKGIGVRPGASAKMGLEIWEAEVPEALQACDEHSDRALGVLVKARQCGMQHAIGDPPIPIFVPRADLGARLMETQVAAQVVDRGTKGRGIDQHEPERLRFFGMRCKADSKPETRVPEPFRRILEELREVSKRDEGVGIRARRALSTRWIDAPSELAESTGDVVEHPAADLRFLRNVIECQFSVVAGQEAPMPAW